MPSNRGTYSVLFLVFCLFSLIHCTPQGSPDGKSGPPTSTQNPGGLVGDSGPGNDPDPVEAPPGTGTDDTNGNSKGYTGVMNFPKGLTLNEPNSDYTNILVYGSQKIKSAWNRYGPKSLMRWVMDKVLFGIDAFASEENTIFALRKLLPGTGNYYTDFPLTTLQLGDGIRSSKAEDAVTDLPVPDESILVGTRVHESGKETGAFVKVGPLGNPDPSFGPEGNGMTFAPFPLYKIYRQPQDKSFVAAGTVYQTTNSTAKPYSIALVKALSNGKLDDRFGYLTSLLPVIGVSAVKPPVIEALLIAPLKIYVAGSFHQSPTVSLPFIACFESVMGTPCKVGNSLVVVPAPRGETAVIKSLAVKSNGDVVAGAETTSGKTFIVSYNSSLALNMSFGTGGIWQPDIKTGETWRVAAQDRRGAEDLSLYAMVTNYVVDSSGTATFRQFIVSTEVKETTAFSLVPGDGSRLINNRPGDKTSYAELYLEDEIPTVTDWNP